jgi:predicted XRE-type DNA-binding protein
MLVTCRGELHPGLFMPTAKARTSLNRERGASIAVRDPAALGTIVDDVIKERCGGSQSHAASVSSISQPQLSRLVNGGCLKVSESTLKAIVRFVGPGRESTVYAAVCSERERERLARYRSWIWDNASRQLYGHSLRDAQRLSTDEVSDRVGQFGRMLVTVTRAFPDEFARLDKALLAGGHDRARRTLGYTRILAPLLGALDTDGIERSLGEFNRRELRHFIRAGVKRELLLLDRSIDVARAQRRDQRSSKEARFDAKLTFKLLNWYERKSPWGAERGGEVAVAGTFLFEPETE